MQASTMLKPKSLSEPSVSFSDLSVPSFDGTLLRYRKAMDKSSSVSMFYGLAWQSFSANTKLSIEKWMVHQLHRIFKLGNADVPQKRLCRFVSGNLHK